MPRKGLREANSFGGVGEFARAVLRASTLPISRMYDHKRSGFSNPLELSVLLLDHTLRRCREGDFLYRKVYAKLKLTAGVGFILPPIV